MRDYANKMIGNTLITKQTGSLGKKCEMVYVVERTFLRKELYLSILLDRTSGSLGVVASEKGGIHIEEGDPNYIKKFNINFPKDVEGIDAEIYSKVAEVYRLNAK